MAGGALGAGRAEAAAALEERLTGIILYYLYYWSVWIRPDVIQFHRSGRVRKGRLLSSLKVVGLTFLTRTTRRRVVIPKASLSVVSLK